jgi:hypothetical protein
MKQSTPAATESWQRPHSGCFYCLISALKKVIHSF